MYCSLLNEHTMISQWRLQWNNVILVSNHQDLHYYCTSMIIVSKNNSSEGHQRFERINKKKSTLPRKDSDLCDPWSSLWIFFLPLNCIGNYYWMSCTDKRAFCWHNVVVVVDYLDMSCQAVESILLPIRRPAERAMPTRWFGKRGSGKLVGRTCALVVHATYQVQFEDDCLSHWSWAKIPSLSSRVVSDYVFLQMMMMVMSKSHGSKAKRNVDNCRQDFLFAYPFIRISRVAYPSRKLLRNRVVETRSQLWPCVKCSGLLRRSLFPSSYLSRFSSFATRRAR